MRTLSFLVQPPRTDPTAKYEPFPANGEPIYTTHPAFKYDSALNRTLAAFHIQMWAIVKGGHSGTATPGAQAWLDGEAPIPDADWKIFMRQRAESLLREKLRPDTPIGYQFAAGGAGAWRLPRPLDFVRDLFGRGPKSKSTAMPAVAPSPVAEPSAKMPGKRHALTAD